MEKAAGLSLQIAQGDAAGFYYQLSLPDGFDQFFVIEGILGEDLKAYMESEEGLSVDIPSGLLGLSVVAMGWSWGVFLAQAALRDAVACESSSAQNGLVEGAPAPVLELGRDLRYVHSEYVDDFSVIGLGTSPIESCCAAASYAEGAKTIRGSGLAVHKESLACASTFLGC